MWSVRGIAPLGASASIHNTSTASIAWRRCDNLRLMQPRAGKGRGAARPRTGPPEAFMECGVRRAPSLLCLTDLCLVSRRLGVGGHRRVPARGHLLGAWHVFSTCDDVAFAAVSAVQRLRRP